jgi:CDP-diacylglycerol--glycerol-3-phosphate 3-phosphatidyltransferase
LNTRERARNRQSRSSDSLRIARGRRADSIRRHLPNIMTWSRLVLTVIFVWLMSFEGPVSSALALLTFTLAALTDWADGALARKYGVVSPFGVFMDPFADKVLILSALLVFLWQNIAPVWMVLLIWVRELTVTGLRIMAKSRGVSIAAAPSGKQKMLSQTLAVIGILVIQSAQYLISERTGLPWDTALKRLEPHGAMIAGAMGVLPWYVLLAATVLSVYSGVDFIIRHRRLFKA